MITLVTIGKLAGLLEGEGCFQCIKKPNGRHLLRIDIFTTDKDVADWVGLVINKKVYGPYRPSKASSGTKTFAGKKELWGVVAQGARAAGVMMTILPLLHARRREKVLTSLAIWKSESLFRGPSKKTLSIHQQEQGNGDALTQHELSLAYTTREDVLVHRAEDNGLTQNSDQPQVHGTLLSMPSHMPPTSHAGVLQEAYESLKSCSSMNTAKEPTQFGPLDARACAPDSSLTTLPQASQPEAQHPPLEAR